jgi:dihydrolipoamide dehydrogenase
MYDVVIIGAGPGGYVAGIRASQLGLKTCVIEKDKPGGTCLNVGCIPTKNLIYQAQIFESQKELAEAGLKLNESRLDFSKVLAKSRRVAETLVGGVELLLTQNKISYIKNTARIATESTIVLGNGDEIKGKNIIIATGARPAEIPGFEIDEKVVFSSTGILNLEQLPKSLIILGGGAIGCEFAYIMNSFGVEIYLVEMANQIMPSMDNEAVSIIHNVFTEKGIHIMPNNRAVSLRKNPKSTTVVVDNQDGSQERLNAEKVLCALGRTPNTENIGLDTIGLKTENSFIPVHDFYQTPVKGVFAIGDVIATPQLAHVASKEGEIAVEYIAGKMPEPKINTANIIFAVYCEPQLASFGLTEEQAKDKGIAYKKVVFPFRAIGKAVTVNSDEGLIKVLFDQVTREILGAHIVGQEATELIHELLLAKTAELLPEDIASMIHAHPTLSEGIREAMLAIDGQSIHI